MQGMQRFLVKAKNNFSFVWGIAPAPRKARKVCFMSAEFINVHIFVFLCGTFTMFLVVNTSGEDIFGIKYHIQIYIQIISIYLK